MNKKTKLGETIWVDSSRLRWKKDTSFGDALKSAIEEKQKISLTKDNPTPATFKWVYSDPVQKFMNETFVPMLEDAYKYSKALEENKYNQIEELLWVLDKNSLKEWDKIYWIVNEWNSKTKKYSVLVWKDWDKKAWLYIKDSQEKRYLNKWDKVYFVAKKWDKWWIFLEEYYPLEWDLNVGDVIDLKFANVFLDKVSTREKDPQTWQINNKKLSLWYYHIKLWEYSAVLDKKILPRNYKPWRNLKLRIKEIVKKNNKLFLKFENVLKD